MHARLGIGRRSAILGLGAAATAFIARANSAKPAALAIPSDTILLTVTGKIAIRNVPGKAAFDRAMLDALPQAAFTTGSPWTARSTFSGVLLRTLLDAVGSTGRIAYAYALNDYVAEIPIVHLPPDGPLLATRMNGAPMPIDRFGPIFVMYDFAKHPDLLRNDIYARCIWQLDRMVLA